VATKKNDIGEKFFLHTIVDFFDAQSVADGTCWHYTTGLLGLNIDQSWGSKSMLSVTATCFWASE